MITLQTASPNLMLRQFVRFYAQREVQLFGSGETSVIEALPARLEQTLEFQFGRPFVVHHLDGRQIETPAQAIVGAQVKGCSRIELEPGVLSFAIFF